MRNKILSTLFFILIAASAAFSQTTAFTYQGSLKDGASAANGNYDFEFALYDSLTGGTQLGSTLSRNTVSVANGIFSVSLDFGSQFPGANRFLEIHVRPTGQPGITVLAPRQPVNSAPYSVKSLSSDTAGNASSLNNQPASFYTNASNLTSGTIPAAQLGNGAILNQAGQQAGANFNISGTGTAGILNAAELDLSGTRVLSTAGTNNLFAGAFSGIGNSTGTKNSFFGAAAGGSNTTGRENSFFGSTSGAMTTTGNSNAFFGASSGAANTTGNLNSFFGQSSGASNASGMDNSFFGWSSGGNNTTGGINSFFGETAGGLNTTGSFNSFFGQGAGFTNTTGTRNTVIGFSADVGAENLTNATAIGFASVVSQSNSLVLGSSLNSGGLADTNVGIGTTTPNSRLDVHGDIAIGLSAAPNAPGSNNLYLANDGGDAGNVFRLDGSSDNFYIIARSNAGAAAGTNIVFRTAAAGGGENTRMTVNSTGTVSLNTLGSAGATALCRNASNEIATCSSSLRYKTNIKGFSSGIAFVKRLRPIAFDWKDGGMKDVGFGAEDVAKIDPRFVTYNAKGEVEGVKYDRLSVAFVNAFKEQQAQIEAQQKQNDAQQRQIEALTRALCSLKPAMEICK